MPNQCSKETIMPLLIEIRGALHCPVILCDQCGHKIEDAKEGNYQWDMNQDEAPLYFTHKECCHEFESDRPGIFWGAIDLQALPFYLLQNLEVSYHKAKQVAERMALI
jgi:hypothetical protein